MKKRLLLVVAMLTFAGVAAGTASAAQSICVAANGKVRHQSGTATCHAEGQGSVAIAKGDSSNAFAGFEGDDRNKAKTFGDFSNAAAFDGDRNTATVRGDFSLAAAGDGDGTPPLYAATTAKRSPSPATVIPPPSTATKASPSPSSATGTPQRCTVTTAPRSRASDRTTRRSPAATVASLRQLAAMG